MYQEMEYIFDILYDNDCFEHILSAVRAWAAWGAVCRLALACTRVGGAHRKRPSHNLQKTLLSDPHEQTVLRTSIQDYLKRRHPKDTQNLEMLSLHFSVFYDIGLNRMHQAQALLKRTVPGKMTNPVALLRDLDLVLQV